MSAYESDAYFAGNDTYKPINPILSKVGDGDFTPFYIVIAISAVVLGALIILNVVCCWWLDQHTGNRWIVSIWSATPHKQPPLVSTELESQDEQVQYVPPYHSKEYQEVKVKMTFNFDVFL